MTLLETDIEREARLRTQRGRPIDITEEPVIPPLVRPAAHTRINRDSSYVEGHDAAAFAVGAVMTLGPLLAYAVGLGA
jgi:hypothetical protein